MPKKKRITITKAKSRAWDAFSRFVRLRDAIRTTKTKEWLLCITCNKSYPAFGKSCAQAGHFIGGRGNSVLIDEQFVWGQCYNCNINLKGNWVVYEKKMIEMWGKKIVEEAKLKHGLIDKKTVEEWLEIEEEYKNKFEELENEN